MAAWLLALFCLAAGLAGRLPYLLRPFDHDGAMFIYTGRVLAEGGRFCHDVTDNKFPASGLMVGLAWRAFGPCWPAYVLLNAALAAATACLLAALARRHGGPGAALPTGLFAAVYLNFSLPSMFGGFHLETPLSFFAALGAFFAADALARRRPAAAFVAGLASGCAALYKPTGLAVAAAFALAALGQAFTRDPTSAEGAGASGAARAVPRHPRLALLARHALALAAGIALPAAAVLFYLVRSDTLADMPGLYRQIADYASHSASEPIDLLKLPIALAFLGFPLAVRAWFGRRRHGPAPSLASPARPPGHETHQGRRQLLAFLLAWLAVESMAVLAQRRMYAYHFLVLVPPAALAFGVLGGPFRPGPAFLGLLPAGVVALAGAVGVLAEPRRPARLELSDYLLRHASPGDRIWQDNMPRLLLETGLAAGSRHVLTFPFANTDDAPLEMGRELLDDLARLRPTYLILPTDFERSMEWRCRSIAELTRFPRRRENYLRAWADLRHFTLAHYAEEAIVGDQTLYRRR